MFSCFLSVQGPPLGWQHPQGTAVHGHLTWFLGVMLGRRGRGPLAEFMLVVMRGWALFLPGGGMCGLFTVCSWRPTKVQKHTHEVSPGLTSLTRGPACLEGAGGPQSCDPTMSPPELRYRLQCVLSLQSPTPNLQVRMRREGSFVDPLLTWCNQGLPGPRGEEPG